MRKSNQFFLLQVCLVWLHVGWAQESPPAAFEILPDAMQRFYGKGVPHTDHSGQRRLDFDEKKSFFPICIYHAMTGQFAGVTYDLSTVKKAGFNCVHLFEGIKLEAAMDDLKKNGLKVIYHNPTIEQIRKYAKDETILGWYLDEEPTSAYSFLSMPTKIMNFQRRMEEIKKYDQVHPVFALDSSWITLPATPWWLKWNTMGDVTSHDNYPMVAGTKSLSSPSGIPETVSLAVSSNGEKKPMWFVAQAFEEVRAKNYRWHMPNPRELRAMVYTALVHGATGIIYFSFDSWVTRNGDVLGISPDPKSDYVAVNKKHLIVSRVQRDMSRSLWKETVLLNKELSSLKKILLAKTSEHKPVVSIIGQSYSKTPIRCLLKSDGAWYTLLCVNIDKTVLNVRIELPFPVSEIEDVLEGGKITLRTKDVSFLFDEYGLKVIRFKAS